ncbi:MAG: rhodanese-like domain-containing protein [Chloroflexi bacterium]|nr:rhodanese-like domain-containing protein [Chloroflexota bacterium]
MIPEITVEELSKRLKSQDQFVLLDVRELSELEYAQITDARLEVAPMSRLGREGINMLSESAKSQTATLYVLCHSGVRSAQVTGWLASRGWKNVFSVAGGIDEYARKIDRSVGMY